MMQSLYNKIRAALEAEHDRLILWAPVCMAFGIAWYFSLKTEPPWWLGGALTLLFLLPAIIAYRLPHPASRIIFYILIIATLFAFGVTLSQYRTRHIHSPYLEQNLSFAEITGKVAEIAPTPKGSKLLLTDVTISKLPPEKTPASLTVTLRAYDPNLVTGQIVSMHAGLFPPPGPALPGGFDFSRYFYFREIGAVGYGIAPVIVKSLKDSGANDFDIWFSGFRHQLTESIRSYFHEPAGAVAAAFVTGEVRAIPDVVNDDMRIAGLYHLLAVSGMNLSVVAGLAFFSLRFLLAAIPGLAVRYPIKKWAALLALIASYVYLRVSGTPVSAERAFFMVSLIFIAILLDREPMPMRSVAFSAFCIMLYEPEAALTASFQLSFSATAALIASYEWGTGWLAKHRSEGYGLARVFFYFAAVIGTSFVAWCATEPFIIYHFNQFSSYSLLSNTIAEPLVSFILMPLVIAGVLLLPFHLAWIAFTPMQMGVNILLLIADWVAHLPHAMGIVPNPTDTGFALACFGGCWVYFWKGRLRWLGLIAVLAGMSTAFWYEAPDIVVSSDAHRIGIRLDDGRFAILRGKPDNITSQQWARAALQRDAVGKDEAPLTCDDHGCIVKLRGHTVAMPKNTEALRDDCELADIVITDEPIAHDACPAPLLIDKTLLDAGGATTVTFKGSRMKMQQTRAQQGARPWAIQTGEEE